MRACQSLTRARVITIELCQNTFVSTVLTIHIVPPTCVTPTCVTPTRLRVLFYYYTEMDLPKGNRVVRFMSVIAVVLVSNLMTYTFCVHGNNFYNSK